MRPSDASLANGLAFDVPARRRGRDGGWRFMRRPVGAYSSSSGERAPVQVGSAAPSRIASSMRPSPAQDCLPRKPATHWDVAHGSRDGGRAAGHVPSTSTPIRATGAFAMARLPPHSCCLHRKLGPRLRFARPTAAVHVSISWQPVRQVVTRKHTSQAMRPTFTIFGRPRSRPSRYAARRTPRECRATRRRQGRRRPATESPGGRRIVATSIFSSSFIRFHERPTGAVGKPLRCSANRHARDHGGHIARARNPQRRTDFSITSTRSAARGGHSAVDQTDGSIPVDPELVKPRRSRSRETEAAVQ